MFVYYRRADEMTKQLKEVGHGKKQLFDSGLPTS